MESIKIYISLKEAENLIFNRCIILSKSRLVVKKAQGMLSVSINVHQDKLLNFESNLVILFSAVLSFEIPEKEQTLFVNHYRVPLGLLRLNDREVRDTKEKQIEFDSELEATNLKNYVQLRNGLLSICNLRYNNIEDAEFSKSGETILYEFNSLPEFRQKMLAELLNTKKFPVLQVKLDKFVAETFFRITWWGKFIIDNYVNQIENKSVEDIELIKKWFRGFLQFDDIKKINELLSEMPDSLNNERDFIFGYYFAAVNFESFESDADYLKTLNNEIKYTRQTSLVYWISFFKSLFDKNMDYLYFVKSIDSEVYKIEKLAFELSTSNFQNSENINFEFVKVDDKKLLSDYLTLKEGGVNHNPQIINLNEAKVIFNNNLSEEKLKLNGFELKSEYENNEFFLNTCWFSRKKFHLNINLEAKIGDIIFYTYENSKAKTVLKSLKLKEKPLAKLLDANKKILVGFWSIDTNPQLIKIYSMLLKNEIRKKFDKVIIVLEVDLDAEKIQSIEFSEFRKKNEKDFKLLFDIDIEFIVKNKRNKNDIEIKRNLKNSLKNYKMGQIEVVDENFDDNKAGWLLQSNTEYLIKSNNEEYYSFLNID